MPDDAPRSREMDPRLDRNFDNLLNELRIAGTGVQVLFAFLLIVPFNTRWAKVPPFDHYEYFVTLLCVATATVLLIAPSVHHRILIHRGERAYLLAFGTRCLIVAMGFLSLGMVGILLLITHVLFGAVPAVLTAAVGALFLGLLWFAIPLARRERDIYDADS